MRKLLKALLTAMAVVVLTAGMGLWVPATAQAHSTCAVRWGSLPKAGPELAMTTAPIVDVRAGRHACFDRLVVDVAGSLADAYDVRYVPAVLADGTGNVVPLRGGAFLHVLVRSPVYDLETGAQTYRFANGQELVGVGGARTFRQVAYGGSFEGQTTIGLGVRARLPFRTFVLAGPGSGSRLVIDVAHRW